MLTLITVLVIVGSGFFFFGQVSTQLENLSLAVNALTQQVSMMGAIDARQDKEMVQALDREIKSRHGDVR